MITPKHEKMVLAYVRTKSPHDDYGHCLVTFAIFDVEKNSWYDILKEYDNQDDLDVIHWEEIPPPAHYYKWAVPLKSFRYLENYRNITKKTN